MNTKRFLLLSALVLFLPITSCAYDFSAVNNDGVAIYYNTSGAEATVTYKSSSYNSYSGTVVIPKTVTYSETTYGVTSIGKYAFERCMGLTSIYSLNPEPPTYYSTTFTNTPKSTCALYVPNGLRNAYSTASQWKDIKSIAEMDITPLSGITADGNAEAMGYYTTDGKQVPVLQRGINIIRYSDGTTKKVIIK